MLPISELAPKLIHPVFGKTMTELLKEIPETDQKMKLLKDQ